ncbi:hypothetical protein PWT90_04252 [Aphanocladium album]|nr:hypothetical protein PWT90_04252 [Aphanocladium album]
MTQAAPSVPAGPRRKLAGIWQTGSWWQSQANAGTWPSHPLTTHTQPPSAHSAPLTTNCGPGLRALPDPRRTLLPGQSRPLSKLFSALRFSLQCPPSLVNCTISPSSCRPSALSPLGYSRVLADTLVVVVVLLLLLLIFNLAASSSVHNYRHARSPAAAPVLGYPKQDPNLDCLFQFAALPSRDALSTPHLAAIASGHKLHYLCTRRSLIQRSLSPTFDCSPSLSTQHLAAPVSSLYYPLTSFHFHWTTRPRQPLRLPSLWPAAIADNQHLHRFLPAYRIATHSAADLHSILIFHQQPNLDGMPRELDSVFSELGLAQYLDAFVDQGFDSWDTILDVQESDLDALGVKLGHRRKLQRRIANARGFAPSVPLVSMMKTGSEDNKQQLRRESAARSEADSELTNGVTKRKYRRHPKLDENAPERPPSAYVLFSNIRREELKSHNLCFTEIAKLVGEKWQNLDQAERESYDNQANTAKAKYRRSLAEYKKTPEFRRYAQYLQEFKEKQSKYNQGYKDHLRKDATRHHILGRPITDRKSATELSKRQRVESKPEPARLCHDSSHGSTTRGDTPTGTISSVTSGTTGSIASIAESQMSSTAPTALSHINSFDEIGVLPRSSQFDNSPIDGRHSQHSASWYNRSNSLEHNELPKQLPSLFDMLYKDSQSGLGGRLPLAGSPLTGMVSPKSYHGEDVVKRNRGSKLPDSRRTGDSALPIHALSNTAASNSLNAKAPRRRPNMLISRDTVEARPGAPGYVFLSNSPTFRHMRTEQSGDGDVVMTTMERPPPECERERFDGMSALLQASEIVGRRADRC